MKIRIASSIALAAIIMFGATGCGLFAPQATTEQYAPSDGVEASLDGVDVRNLILVAAEDGEHFNVVFTGVNTRSESAKLVLAFEANGASATAEFVLKPGTRAFGDPEGEFVLVSLPDVKIGSTVTAFAQVAGAEDREMQVPVLDGILAEYAPYVVPRAVISGPQAEEDDEIADEQQAGAEASTPQQAGDAAQ